ncbi:MAG: DUF2723 domain-containing protein, partial [Deltaproteobacteria bacterium]|nr:DUF2723 domain-containing protein [Deltaproteobacteria bacterium]
MNNDTTVSYPTGDTNVIEPEDKWPVHILLLFSLAITLFYVNFSAPGIGWRDGPEFSVSSVFLDVSHPSGFPAYNLIAKIMTWIPLGAIGFRVTAFTALMGGLSIFVFAVLLKNLHRLSDGENEPAHWFLFAPLLLYALDKAIFASSTEPEVYSLNTFFILVLLLFALKWFTGNGIAWLYSGAFVYGLSAGNHAAVGLYLPVLLLLTVWGEPRNETPDKTGLAIRGKRIATLALFFLIGFSVYFLLLVRSQTDRLPIDFGRTDTWERFWRHLTDAKDSETHFQGIRKLEDLGHILPLQIKNLFSPLFWFSVPFFAWGLKWLWKNYQIL